MVCGEGEGEQCEEATIHVIERGEHLTLILTDEDIAGDEIIEEQDKDIVGRGEVVSIDAETGDGGEEVFEVEEDVSKQEEIGDVRQADCMLQLIRIATDTGKVTCRGLTSAGCVLCNGSDFEYAIEILMMVLIVQTQRDRNQNRR